MHENQHHDIEQPKKIEKTIIQQVLHVRDPIQEVKMLMRHQYIKMLAQTKTDEGLAPALTLLEQRVPLGRHTGHADGIFGKIYFITRLSDFLGNVTIQSGTYIPHPYLHQFFTVKGSEST